MNSKYLYLIPLFLMEIILQLIFFWLAPEVPCYWVVYVFGTVMSLIHIGITFFVEISYGMRKGTATVIAGSICMLIFIVACCILLISRASVRNAIFALLIASIVYVVIVTLLALELEEERNTSATFITSLDYETEDVNREEREVLESNDFKTNERTIPLHDLTIDNAVTPPPLPTKR